MRQQSTMPAGQPATIPLDFDGHVSRHVARRVRQLIGETTLWSIDGHEARTYRGYVDAGVRLPRPTLVRGTVGTPPRRHRVELRTDEYGVPLGTCDCRAAERGIPCSHLWSLAAWAVSIGWRSA